MESISNYKLELLLRKVSRCQPVSLATVTDPDMNKRGNPYAGVARKVCFVTGFICWQYQRTVNRQRIREGKSADFKAEPRKWGQRIKGTPLVVHVNVAGETHHYLEMKIERPKSHYFDRNTFDRIEYGDIKPYLRKKSDATTQQVERPVILRDYRLDRIAEITISGERYSITPAASELQQYFPGNVTDGEPRPTRVATMAAG